MRTDRIREDDFGIISMAVWRPRSTQNGSCLQYVQHTSKQWFFIVDATRLHPHARTSTLSSEPRLRLAEVTRGSSIGPAYGYAASERGLNTAPCLHTSTHLQHYYTGVLKDDINLPMSEEYVLQLSLLAEFLFTTPRC